MRSFRLIGLSSTRRSESRFITGVILGSVVNSLGLRTLGEVMPDGVLLAEASSIVRLILAALRSDTGTFRDKATSRASWNFRGPNLLLVSMRSLSDC